MKHSIYTIASKVTLAITIVALSVVFRGDSSFYIRSNLGKNSYEMLVESDQSAVPMESNTDVISDSDCENLQGVQLSDQFQSLCCKP